MERLPVTREDVWFEVRGLRCAAWLFRPAGHSGPGPAVVIGHGYSGVRDLSIDFTGERLAEAGYPALVFDYRSFGASEGEPRQVGVPGREAEDWRTAIGWMRSQPFVDPARVAILGSSMGGALVLNAALEDPTIGAVIAQCPIVDALGAISEVPLAHTVTLMSAALRDGVRGMLGLDPHYVKVAGRPGERAIFNRPGVAEEFEAIVPDGSSWENRGAPRFLLQAHKLRPLKRIDRLIPPLLVCISDDDQEAPPSLAAEAAERAPRGEARHYDTGHFGIYAEGPLRDSVVADQIEFLRRVLPHGRPG